MKTVCLKTLLDRKLVIVWSASAVLSAMSLVALAEETLSPAEQAVLAQQQAEHARQFRFMCEDTILHGSDTDKAALIEQLDGKTCEEAAQTVSTTPPAN